MAGTSPEPQLAKCVEHLNRCGWDLVIVSAGSSWYIDRILSAAGVKATVHSNPGRIESGRGLVLELPRNSAFFCADIGISKPDVVRDALVRYDRVAFAGDGRPDIAASLLVPPERRFARRFLAEELTRKNENFRRFSRWAEVVESLAC